MAEETGKEPSALLNRPEIWPWLSFTWSAWWELHSDRQMTMGGPLRIPFTSIDRYADRYGIAGVDSFDAFRELIRAMDGAYLKWAEERSQTK